MGQRVYCRLFAVKDKKWIASPRRERRRLIERITRFYQKASERPHDLGHRVNDGYGRMVFVANIEETIILHYLLTKDRLIPDSCSLRYKTQAQDILCQVAQFYFGPLAPRNALLAFNPDLAAKHMDPHPGAVISLDPGSEITIPVPEDWLIARFGHGLKRE